MEGTANVLRSLQFEIVILQAEHLQAAPFIFHQLLYPFGTDQIIPQTQLSNLLSHLCKAGFEIHYALIADIPAADVEDSLHLFDPTIDDLPDFGSDHYSPVELISSERMHSDHVVLLIPTFVEDWRATLARTRVDTVVYEGQRLSWVLGGEVVDC